jgi:hypothetical protein
MQSKTPFDVEFSRSAGVKRPGSGSWSMLPPECGTVGRANKAQSMCDAPAGCGKVSRNLLFLSLISP